VVYFTSISYFNNSTTRDKSYLNHRSKVTDELFVIAEVCSINLSVSFFHVIECSKISFAQSSSGWNFMQIKHEQYVKIYSLFIKTNEKKKRIIIFSNINFNALCSLLFIISLARAIKIDLTSKYKAAIFTCKIQFIHGM
jgi:hypothetical protein